MVGGFICTAHQPCVMNLNVSSRLAATTIHITSTFVWRNNLKLKDHKRKIINVKIIKYNWSHLQFRCSVEAVGRELWKKPFDRAEAEYQKKKQCKWRQKGKGQQKILPSKSSWKRTWHNLRTTAEAAARQARSGPQHSPGPTETLHTAPHWG